MNRQTTKNIILVITLAVLVCSAILLAVLPKQKISQSENRYLEKFPEITRDTFFSGEAMEDFEIYINDHFPFRDFFVGIKSRVDKLIGKKEINGIYLGDDEYLIQDFKGYETAVMDRHIAIVNEFAENNDFDTYFLLAPTSSSIYADKKPKFNTDEDQIECIEKFYDELTNVTTIDVHTELLKNKDEEQLYFRLDHHWNGHGAYVAYTQVCGALNITPYEKSEFDIETVADDFCGTYYSKATYYGYTEDVIEVFVPKFKYNYTVEYVKEKVTTDTLYSEDYLMEKDKYAYFLDGNHSQIKITNNAVEYDSSIVIVKDSYANIFIPFIVSNYKYVYIIDMRFFTQPLSEYVIENNADTVLFLYNIHTIRDDIGILRVE